MRLSQSQVAKKYAKAYLNEYASTLTLTDIERMKAVMKFCRAHHNFMSLVSLLAAEHGGHHVLIDEMFDHFSLPDSLKKLVDVMIRHKRLTRFAAILQDICCLYSQRNNLVDLTIYSAVELESHEQESFEQFFAKLSSKKIMSRVVIDESLIAGVRLQSDTLLWEYSIAGRIKQLLQNIDFKK